MKNTFSILLITTFLFVSCSDTTTYSITENSVGPLTKTTIVSELSTLFAEDSLIDDSGRTDFITPQGDVSIFEKDGKELMIVTPKENTDDSQIKIIQILDNRYQTPEGISLNSTFKDIAGNYEIRSIENLIGTIVIFIKDSDAYFTIDKKHLAKGLMFDTDSKIEASQIPDEAPIKYFHIGWD